jgi:hypothetical protein
MPETQLPEPEDGPDAPERENVLRALAYPLILFIGVPILLSLIIRYLL